MRTIVEGMAEPGIHEAVWDAKDDRDIRVASGIDLFRLEADGGADTQKVALPKQASRAPVCEVVHDSSDRILRDNETP